MIELKVPAKQPPAGGKQSSKFEGLDIELPPPEAVSPQIKLDDMEERRKPSGGTSEAVCKFCRGPLNLEGGFCEYCGAPIEEAAPPGLIKPKPKPAAITSNLAVPPPENAPSQPVAVAAGAGLAIPSVQAPPPVSTPPVGEVPKTTAAAAGGGLAIPPAPAVPAAPGEPKLAVALPGAALKAPSVAPAATPPQEVSAGPLPPKGSERVAVAPTAPAKALAIPSAKMEEPTLRQMPAGPPPFAVPGGEAPQAAALAKKRPLLMLGGVVLGGIGIVLVAAGVAAWYFLRPKAAPVRPPSPAAATRPAATAPAPEPAAPAPEASAPGEAAAVAPQPRVARAAKPAPAPAPVSAPEVPATDPKRAQIANLQNLARDAYSKGNYAEPAGENAVAYLTQALALDANDDYSKKLLESAVSGGTYQVQQAIAKKDFATAHRVADAMAQLLPGRSDVAGLKEDIASAQRAAEAARQPQEAAPQVSFRVMHMHTDKPPADKGPYCLGSLSVAAGHLKFAAQSATDGQPHQFDVACSDVKEVKKNARVASHQGGFHVRTTQTNYNFVPADAGSAPAPALASACAK